jgi:hypothetical protein
MLVRRLEVLEVLRERSWLAGHPKTRGLIGDCYGGVLRMCRQFIPHRNGIVETSERDIRALLRRVLKCESSFVEAIVGVIRAAKQDRDLLADGSSFLAN